jgi:hypothetical protein
MLSPKYSLNLCTCLIWFEFETWLEFKLKTLEKIKRKAIRNSEKKGKSISAQASLVQPIGAARARAAQQVDSTCQRRFLPPTRSPPPPSA